MELMRMTRWNSDRIAAASGIAFVVLAIAAALVGGPPPDVKDRAAEVVDYYRDYRTGLLIGSYLSGLAYVTFVWFAAVLARRIWAAGEQRLAAVAFGGALLAVAAVLVADTVNYSLAWRGAEDASAETVKAVYDVQALFFTRLWFATAVLSLATAIAAGRARLLPQWYVLLSAATGLWHLVPGAATAREGFFSPQGPPGFIAYLLFLLWVLVTSILLVRRREPEVMPQA